MNRELLIIVLLSIAISAGVVGGMYYLYMQDLQSNSRTEIDAQQKNTARTQSQKPASGQTKWNKPQPRTHTSDTPMKCTQLDGSVFYTNLPRCEDADLNNRISHVDPVKPVPRVTLEQKPKRRVTRQPSSYADRGLILVDRSPSSFRQPCKFPIGMAQKIEKKSLKLKDDPKDSVWRSSYCRWVCEAEREQCGRTDRYLLYAGMCSAHRYQSLRDCDDVY